MRLLVTTTHRYHIKGILTPSMDTLINSKCLKKIFWLHKFILWIKLYFCRNKSLRISNDNLYKALLSIFSALSIIPVLLLSQCFGIPLLNNLNFIHHNHHKRQGSVPSPELQLLSPTFLRSSSCSSLWSVVI